MARILRMRSTFARPSDTTQYAAGDEISNSAVAASVVRPTFTLAGFTRGRLLSAAIDVSADSGNIVIVALNLALMLFKTAEVPAAVGDNVTMPITGANYAKRIGKFLFDDGGWENPLGAFTAGTSGYQETPATMPVPLATPTIAAPHVPGHFFDFSGGETPSLTAVLTALAAWDPGTEIDTFGITLELEVE